MLSWTFRRFAALQTKTLISALVVFSALSLLALALLSAIGADHMSREEDVEVIQGLGLIEQANGLSSAVQQEIIIVRGEFLTGRRGSSAAAFRRVDQALTAYKLSDQTPENQQLLADISQLTLAYRNNSRRVFMLYGSGHDQAAVTLAMGAGKRIKDQLLGDLGTLIAREHASIRQHHERVNQTEARTKLALVVAPAISIPILLLLSLLVLRRVNGPLADLEAASRAIARGRTEVRVQPRHDDEFGRVAQAFNTMAEAVESSVRGLQTANLELQKADRYKDEFLSMISHELRTPLHFVKGFASLLGSNMAGPLTEEQRGHVQSIITGADRMLLMVNELLESAALRAGKLRLNLERTIYPPLVENVLANLKPLADEKRLQVSLEVRSSDPIRVDREHVTRIITNLVANAIKFTPADGHIDVIVETQGAELVTEVRDTGIGIPPEFLPSLFQPFSQLDMSSTRRTGGTGLGLSICKALVDAHGGTIEVESQVGTGSTFRFRLPLVPAAQTPAAAPA